MTDFNLFLLSNCDFKSLFLYQVLSVIIILLFLLKLNTWKNPVLEGSVRRPQV